MPSSRQWSRCYQSSKEKEREREKKKRNKRREDSLSNYMMSDPPSSYICSRRLILLWGPIACCTHDPRIYTHTPTYPHTQTSALCEQQQAAVFYPLFGDLDVVVSLPPGDGSFYCARASGSGNPVAANYNSAESVITFSYFLLVPIRRYGSSLFRDNARFKQGHVRADEITGDRSNFKRTRHEPLSRSEKWKRRPEVKWAVWIMSMHREFHDAHLEKLAWRAVKRNRRERWENSWKHAYVKVWLFPCFPR